MLKAQNSKLLVAASSIIWEEPGCFEHLDFDIVSDFALRISDFPAGVVSDFVLGISGFSSAYGYRKFRN
jgi:hypothetical protein